jgi:D-tyrosyl-tRNA(Tyr) deacylase
VSRAEIRVGDEITGRMAEGLLALVGVAEGDSEDDARYIAQKLVQLRVFPDAEGRMNRSLVDTGGALGIVSQFTLLGDCRKGRRPGWSAAAPPERAEPLIETVIALARAQGIEVVSGRFRARMVIGLTNEGPVTLLLDSRRAF